MDHSTLYRLLIIKNHMTLSLFLVKSVKCDIYTIRDISIHFTYGNGCTQIMYIFYTLVINKRTGSLHEENTQRVIGSSLLFYSCKQ